MLANALLTAIFIQLMLLSVCLSSLHKRGQTHFALTVLQLQWVSEEQWIHPCNGGGRRLHGTWDSRAPCKEAQRAEFACSDLWEYIWQIVWCSNRLSFLLFDNVCFYWCGHSGNSLCCLCLSTAMSLFSRRCTTGCWSPLVLTELQKLLKFQYLIRMFISCWSSTWFLYYCYSCLEGKSKEMLLEPQQGAEVQMKSSYKRSRCKAILLHLFFEFVLDYIFQDVPASVTFGMLSKIRKQRKRFVAHTRCCETSCNAAVNACSSTELLRKGWWEQ